MEDAPWVELPPAYFVEAFGGLQVAFAQFGAEGAGIFADVVAFEGDVVFAVIDPEFEGFFFFEDADEDGLTKGEVMGG